MKTMRDKHPVSDSRRTSTGGLLTRLFAWINDETWRAPAILGLVIVARLAWLSAFLRFTHIDEIGYKAPGLSYFHDGVFAVSEYRGLDQSFLNAVPGHDGCFALYPFLFATWIGVVGFTKVSCVLFDGVIQAALASVVYAFGRAFFPRVPRLCPLAAAILLPLGTPGRADNLACVFGLLGVALLAKRKSILWTLGAAVSYVACITTHPQDAVVIAPTYLATLACVEPATRSRVFIEFAGACTAMLVATLVPAFVFHPDLVEAFRSGAAHYLGNRDLGNDQSWTAKLAFAWRFGKFGLSLAFALASVGVVDLAELHSKGNRWAQLWLGPVASIALVLLLMPGRIYYYYCAVPWMWVVAAGRLVEQWEARSTPSLLPRLLESGLFLAGFFLGGIPELQSAIVLTTLPAAQRFETNVATVRSIIPIGSRVVTIEFWPALAADHQVYHPDFSRLNASDIDFIILTGNGSGQPGVGQGWPMGVTRDDFECVHDNLLFERNKIFGVPISRSGNGFGTLIYRNRHAPSNLRGAGERSNACGPSI